MKIHNIKSFLKHAPYEKSTWIGLIILFGWFFKNNIHQLITNIFNSQLLANSIVNSISVILNKISDIVATTVAGILLAYYSSHDKKKK